MRRRICLLGTRPFNRNFLLFSEVLNRYDDGEDGYEYGTAQKEQWKHEGSRNKIAADRNSYAASIEGGSENESEASKRGTQGFRIIGFEIREEGAEGESIECDGSGGDEDSAQDKKCAGGRYGASGRIEE